MREPNCYSKYWSDGSVVIHTEIDLERNTYTVISHNGHVLAAVTSMDAVDAFMRLCRPNFEKIPYHEF
jgi:hypothetical protein